MASIAKIVEDIVIRKTFLADFLSRGLINYATLADELLPQVQAETSRDVKPAAVVMALRRLSSRLVSTELKPPKFSKNCEVMIRSNLFNLTVVSTPSAFEVIHDFREKIALDRGEIFTVTHGLHELTVISNRIHLDSLRHELRNETVMAIFPRLSMLLIRIPNEDYSKTPGYLYTLTKTLAWEDINIIEVISTYSEVGFTISDADVPRGYAVIMDLISAAEQS
jgi:hypothetical protein